jgi:uroporphyrinogen III methyltransferase/synthase
VQAVTAYAPAPIDADPEALSTLAAGEVDVAVFFSPSALRGVLDMLAQVAVNPQAAFRNTKVACIGPTTAAEAQEAGLQVDIVPEVYTLEGLVEALVQWRKQPDAR